MWQVPTAHSPAEVMVSPEQDAAFNRLMHSMGLQTEVAIGRLDPPFLQRSSQRWPVYTIIAHTNLWRPEGTQHKLLSVVEWSH